MFNRLFQLARLSLRDPKRGAAAVLEIRLPLQEAVELSVLVVLLGAILSSIYLDFDAGIDEDQAVSIFAQPVVFAAFQGAILFAVVIATYLIGRMVGGRGDFTGTIVIMAWLQFIMLLFQLLQVVAAFLAPAMDGFLAIVSIVLFFWLFANFVKVLHGFQSVFKVLAGTFMAMVAIFAGVAAIIASLAGI